MPFPRPSPCRWVGATDTASGWLSRAYNTHGILKTSVSLLVTTGGRARLISDDAKRHGKAGRATEEGAVGWLVG